MNCEICQHAPATEFMVVRQTKIDGGERVAKAHVCMGCFEQVAKDDPEAGYTHTGSALCVESVSAQDFNEVVESL